jgi:hypothetical protein
MPLFRENIKTGGIPRGRFRNAIRDHDELLRNFNADNLPAIYLGRNFLEVWRGGIFDRDDAKRLTKRGKKARG